MRLTSLITLLLFCMIMRGQKAIKLNKQKTNFFYTQLNLHGGYIQEGKNDPFLDIFQGSPPSQLAFQFLKKNQKTLQKGYIKSIRPASYFVRFTLPYNSTRVNEEILSSTISFQLLNAWVKFNTKWDRTSIWIGNKSIPFGHNPRIDQVTNFGSNLTNMEIGLVRDIGLFLKTPLNKKLDIELSIGSGGYLPDPLVESDFRASEIPTSFKLDFAFPTFQYQNTFLLSGRMGNQSFKKNELGLSFLYGNIASPIPGIGIANTIRVGTDWVYKYRERFKLSTQLSAGAVSPSYAEWLFSGGVQGNLDWYLTSTIILSTTFAGTYSQLQNNDLYSFRTYNTNNITFVVSPHTRFRINHFTAYNKLLSEQKDWGILIQFVTGIGKRN